MLCLSGHAQCFISHYVQSGAKCHFSVSPILYPQLNVYILWAALKIMVHFTRPSIHAIISFCFWICKPLNTSAKKSILSIYLCIELRLSYHTSYSVSWNEPSTFLWCESSVEHVRSWARLNDAYDRKQLYWLLTGKWSWSVKKYLLAGVWALYHCLELLIS